MKNFDLNNIYHHKNYRSYMFQRLASEGKRGQISSAAQHLGVQPSFISRVLNEEIHLTNDHGFKLCGFWSLDSFETEYFIKLVELARAGSFEYQEFLEKQIEALRSKHLDIAKRTGREKLDFEGQSAVYFSSWIFGSIHFMTAIHGSQTVASISKKLGLAQEVVEETLYRLRDMNFVKNHGDKWDYVGGEFHLAKKSPLAIQNNFNWRCKAIMQSQLPSEDGIHYTHIYTISKKDLDIARSRVLDLIAELNRLAAPSKSEEQVVLNLDLFKTAIK